MRGRQLRRMFRFLDRNVAINAVQFAMNRRGENLGTNADPLFRLSFLARLEFGLVAIQAILVGYGWRRFRNGFGGARAAATKRENHDGQ